MDHYGTVRETDFELDQSGRKIRGYEALNEILPIRNNGVVVATMNRPLIETVMVKDYRSLDSEVTTFEAEYTDRHTYGNLPNTLRSGYQLTSVYSNPRSSQRITWNGDGSSTEHVREEIQGPGNKLTTREIMTQINQWRLVTSESGFETESDFELDPQTSEVISRDIYKREILRDPGIGLITRDVHHEHMRKDANSYESWVETFSYPSPTSVNGTGTTTRVGYRMEYSYSPFRFRMITWLWDGSVIDISYPMYTIP